MKSSILTLSGLPLILAAAAVAAPATAEETTFDFADPKGVNGVTFVLDSELEPIVGIAGGISGEITFDPEAPESFAGSISLAVDQIKLVNDTMVQHLRGEQWLNIAENLEVTVEFGEVLEVVAVDEDAAEDADDNGADEGVLLIVEGTIRFGGAAVEKEFEVFATFIPDGGTQRGRGEGDLLVLRSEFEVNRYDLGIDKDSDSVADDIWVIVPIAGYAK